MKRNKLLIGAVLFQAAACADVDDTPDAGDLEFRGSSSGVAISVAHPGGKLPEGSGCFSIEYPCRQPLEMWFNRDSEELAHFVHDGSIDDSEANEAPSMVCVDFEDVPSKRYTFSVTATCGGEIYTDDIRLRTRHRSFGIDSVSALQPAYESGEQISFVVDGMATGLDLSVDFSDVDSNYAPGREQITALTDGTYEVRYTLSGSNARPSGDYGLELILTKPGVRGGPDVTERIDLPLRYLPNGAPDVGIGGASYAPEPWRSDLQIDPSATVLSTDLIGPASYVAVHDRTRDDDPLDFSGTAPAPLGVGQQLRIVSETIGPEPRARAVLEIADVGRDGVLRVPVDTSSASCDSTRCTYTNDIWLTPTVQDGSPSVAVSLDIRLRDGATASPASNSSVEMLVDDGFDEELTYYRTQGQLLYEYVDTQPDIDSPTDNSPLIYDWVQPKLWRAPSNVRVLLTDGCGVTVETHTDEHGNFDVLFPSSCPQLEATIEVDSLAQHGSSQVRIGAWRGVVGQVDLQDSEWASDYAGVDQDLDMTHSDLTAWPLSYRRYRASVTTFVPADAGPYDPDNNLLGISNLGMVAFENEIDAGTNGDDNLVNQALYSLDMAKVTLDFLTDAGLSDEYDDTVSVTNIHLDSHLLMGPEGGNEYSVNLSGTFAGFIHIHRNAGYSPGALVHEMMHTVDNSLTIYGTMAGNWPDTENSYNKWKEPMVEALAAAARQSVWRIPLWRSAGNPVESYDVNGNRKNSYSAMLDPNTFSQSPMDFFPDVASAVADCSNGTYVDSSVKSCQDKLGLDQGGACQSHGSQNACEQDQNNDCVWAGEVTSCCDKPTTTEQADCRIAASEGWVWRVMYDLIDDDGAELVETFYDVSDPLSPDPVTTPDFDDFDGGLGALQASELPFIDGWLGYTVADADQEQFYRGREGIDTVDLLDGMVCRGHLTEINANKLLVDAMSFDYDFLPTNSDCTD